MWLGRAQAGIRPGFWTECDPGKIAILTLTGGPELMLRSNNRTVNDPIASAQCTIREGVHSRYLMRRRATSSCPHDHAWGAEQM